MPTNTQINLSIVAGTVPPDRECVKNLTEVLQGVQDFAYVSEGTSTGDGGSGSDSVAEQALNTANTALAAVQEVQAAQKQVRSSGLIPVTNSNSNFTFSFTTPMPSTAYFIQTMLYAGATGVTTDRCVIRVLESSITVNGFTLLLDDIPSNHKIAIYVVEQ